MKSSNTTFFKPGIEIRFHCYGNFVGFVNNFGVNQKASKRFQEPGWEEKMLTSWAKEENNANSTNN